MVKAKDFAARHKYQIGKKASPRCVPDQPRKLPISSNMPQKRLHRGRRNFIPDMNDDDAILQFWTRGHSRTLVLRERSRANSGGKRWSCPHLGGSRSTDLVLVLVSRRRVVQCVSVSIRFPAYEQYSHDQQPLFSLSHGGTSGATRITCGLRGTGLESA